MKKLFFWLVIVALTVSATLVVGAAIGETKTIVYWSMYNEQEPGASAIKKWIEEYKKIKPEINIDVTFAGREVVTKVIAARSGGTVVDLLDMEGFVLRASLVLEGISLVMDEALDTPVYEGEGLWKDSFLPGTLKQYAADDGKVSIIPFNLHTSGFFYDKKLWQDNGWAVPKTWDEFLALCETIKTTSDIAPITHDCGVDFYNDIWNYQIMERLKGPKALLAATGDKTGESWGDPAFKKAIEMEQELFDKGYIVKGAKGFTWPAGQMLLTSGEAAMNLNGSWLPNELRNQVSEDFEWGSFPFPEIAGGVGKINDMESSLNAWAAFNDTKVGPEIVDFLKFCTTVDNQQIFVDGTWNMSAILGTGVPTALESLGQALLDSKVLFDRHDGLAGKYPEYYKNIYLKNHDLAFLGKITPDEYIKLMKEETIRYWEKQ